MTIQTAQETEVHNDMHRYIVYSSEHMCDFAGIGEELSRYNETARVGKEMK